MLPSRDTGLDSLAFFRKKFMTGCKLNTSHLAWRAPLRRNPRLCEFSLVCSKPFTGNSFNVISEKLCPIVGLFFLMQLLCPFLSPLRTLSYNVHKEVCATLAGCSVNLREPRNNDGYHRCNSKCFSSHFFHPQSAQSLLRCFFFLRCLKAHKSGVRH